MTTTKFPQLTHHYLTHGIDWRPFVQYSYDKNTSPRSLFQNSWAVVDDLAWSFTLLRATTARAVKVIIQTTAALSCKTIVITLPSLPSFKYSLKFLIPVPR